MDSELFLNDRWAFYLWRDHLVEKLPNAVMELWNWVGGGWITHRPPARQTQFRDIIVVFFTAKLELNDVEHEIYNMWMERNKTDFWRRSGAEGWINVLRSWSENDGYEKLKQVYRYRYLISYTVSVLSKLVKNMTDTLQINVGPLILLLLINVHM